MTRGFCPRLRTKTARNAREFITTQRQTNETKFLTGTK